MTARRSNVVSLHRPRFTQENELPLYAIYENPSDYPGSFVVRRWVMRFPLTAGRAAHPDRQPHALCGSLAEARAALPAGLVNIGRRPQDDAVIVEVWI